MAPRNIMHQFSIAEISGVDEPAQAPALMTLMKAKGTSHNVETGKSKEGHMPKTPEELQAELNKSAEDLKAANAAAAVTKARLDFLEAYAKMSAEEKAAADEMSEEEKAKFVAAPKEEKEKIVAKRGDKNPVIYKSKAGAEYRKSDDPRLVELAKRDDAREEELAKMRTDAIDASFAKRAGTELAKFKGSVDHKAALLKAVAGIKDDTARTAVSEMLKAAHAAMGLVLKEVGTANDDYATDDTDGANIAKGAENQLDALAKAAMAKDPKLTFAKAYDQVLNTDAGAALYAKASA